MLSNIKEEIKGYKNGSFKIPGNDEYSQYKLVRRISLYENKVYPTGKFDSQGNYKYWYDIIVPRVNAEVKNIDFGRSDILLFSDNKADAFKNILINKNKDDFFDETGEGERLNRAVERFTAWGNVVWKGLGNGEYSVMDLTKFMVLNQTAETLDDSDVIEFDTLSQIDLRRKVGVWDTEAVNELLALDNSDEKRTSPQYYIYERNGEISEHEYLEAKGLSGGDESKYILAKVIVGGIEEEEPTHILFCEEIKKMPYKEAHRTAYAGRWMRVGMYELLFDCQTRANEIGNTIARGLEWAGKTVFASESNAIRENILTDIDNGDIIKSGDLRQVEVRSQGFDQLIADWNRNIQVADQLANSFEIITGESTTSGTPFSLGALQNVNASKLFVFLREKLSLPLQDVISEFILPRLIKDMKSKRVIELTGDSGTLNTYYQILVDSWYIDNLASFPPHTNQEAAELKMLKLEELQRNKKLLVDVEKSMWESYKPRCKVLITGENFNLSGDLETLKSFIQLESDPIRRTALIELAMMKKNIDVSSLPKTPPQVQQPQRAPSGGGGGEQKPAFEKAIEATNLEGK